MKTRKRSYNPRRVRIGQSYSVEEAAALYGLSKGAILNWIKDGLPIIDRQKPYLVHGADLREYLERKRAGRKQKCRLDEFFCFKCRAPRKAWENLVDVKIRNETKLTLSGICAVCNTQVYRAGSVKKLPEYHNIFTLQTTGEERIDDRIPPIVNSDMRKEARP